MAKTDKEICCSGPRCACTFLIIFFLASIAALSGAAYYDSLERAKVEYAKFVPTLDTSEPIKHAIAESRQLYGTENNLQFQVNVTSKLRHRVDHDVQLTSITVAAHSGNATVGYVSTNHSRSMTPTNDSIRIEYKRLSIAIHVSNSIVLRKGEIGYDQCSFTRPFTLPLRLHFTIHYRTENEAGKAIEETLEYDENVEVCCDCDRKHLNSESLVQAKIAKADFVPTLDLSQPVKIAVVEKRQWYGDERNLVFRVNMTSTILHNAHREVVIEHVTVKPYSGDMAVGPERDYRLRNMQPDYNTIRIGYNREKFAIHVSTGIVLRPGEIGYDQCSFIRPFALPLRLHFAIHYRTENNAGKAIGETFEYDENVEVCCDCDRKHLNTEPHEQAQIAKADDVPTLDLSLPVKRKSGEKRQFFGSARNFLFQVHLISTIRHRTDHHYGIMNVTVVPYNGETAVGLNYSDPEQRFTKTDFDWALLRYHRDSIDIHVGTSIVIRRGEIGYDQCSFTRPFTLRLRLRFTVDYRWKKGQGTFYNDTIEYDEYVEVCCDCDEDED